MINYRGKYAYISHELPFQLIFGWTGNYSYRHLIITLNRIVDVPKYLNDILHNEFAAQVRAFFRDSDLNL